MREREVFQSLSERRITKREREMDSLENNGNKRRNVRVLGRWAQSRRLRFAESTPPVHTNAIKCTFSNARTRKYYHRLPVRTIYRCALMTGASRSLSVITHGTGHDLLLARTNFSSSSFLVHKTFRLRHGSHC